MKRIVFDVMIGDRFYDTFRMPLEINMISEYIGDTPVLDIEAIRRKVLEKRPTLKNEDFKIYF